MESPKLQAAFIERKNHWPPQSDNDTSVGSGGGVTAPVITTTKQPVPVPVPLNGHSKRLDPMERQKFRFPKERFSNTTSGTTMTTAAAVIDANLLSSLAEDRSFLATPAAPKTKVRLPTIPPSQCGEDDEDLHLPSSLYLMKLPAGAVPTEKKETDDIQNINENNDNSSSEAVWWPCLVFSNVRLATAMHCRLYHTHKMVHKALSKRMARDMLLTSVGMTSSNNKDDKDNKFAVVLPLKDANGCHSPLYNQMDATTTSPSSNLTSWAMMKQYPHELEAARGTDRYAALMEVERLLSQDVLSSDDDDNETPEENARRKRKRRLSYQIERQALAGKSFRFAASRPGDDSRTSSRTSKTMTTTNLGTKKSGESTYPCSRGRPLRFDGDWATKRGNNEDSSALSSNPRSTETQTGSMASMAGTATASTPQESRVCRASTHTPNPTTKAILPSVKPTGTAANADAAPTPVLKTPAPTQNRSSVIVKKAIRFPKASKRGSSKNKSKTPASKTKTPRVAAFIAKKSRTLASSTKKTTVRTDVTEDGQIEFTLPAWEEVQPLLELFGYTFSNNRYCCLNGDPDKNGAAVLNGDFFETLDDFRDHLCAYGVEYSGRKLPLKGLDGEDDKINTIKNWVNTAIVTKIRNATARRRNFCFEDLTPGEVLGQLQEFGILELRAYHWALPWVQPKEIVGEEIVILEYLGRHGIPQEFKDKIEPKKLAPLEFHLARKFNKSSTTFVKRTTRSRNRDEKSEANCTPAANKDALEACTRAPPTGDRRSKEVLRPKKLLSDEEEPADKDAEKFEAETASVNGSTVGVSGRHPSENPATDRRDRRPNGSKNTKRSTVDDSVPQTPEPVVDLPGKTVREKLQACLAALKQGGDDKIVASGNLQKSHQEIRKFLGAVIKSKGRKGSRSKNHAPILYICGAPGTGKTSSTMQLCKEAIEEEKKCLEEWENPPRVSYQNCSILQNLSKSEAMEKIKRDFQTTNFSCPADVAASSTLILVLDEVDNLVASTKARGILPALSTLAQDEKTVLSLIGISNSVHNKKSNRMIEFGMGGEKLVFQAYRQEELVKITESKIGCSVMNKKAMEFIAAKVAASSGDARRYLELVTLSIDSCLRKAPSVKLDSVLEKPFVTIRDAMTAIRETNVNYRDIIEGLPTFDKVVLCTGVHLARKFDGRSFTMHTLRNLTMEGYGIDYDVEIDDFKGAMERLIDTGLLLLSEDQKNKLRHGMGISDLMGTPMKFDLQLEDVESAIEDTLMNEGFYQRLVNRVKSLHC